MKPFLPIRIFRLTLAVSVSLWMAGAGCLLGCSNSVNAAPRSPTAENNTVIADDSCAAQRSHDCCPKKPKSQSSASNQQPKRSVPEIKSGSGMMENCPLAVSNSAAISKARSDGSDEALGGEGLLVEHEHSRRLNKSQSNIALLFNRGPTYLRCCTFLI
jgi:hypothetical protein